ncbi:MAG: hypothetical protein J5675_00095 [Bacteroidales bacterium]|nr:hypothetical protein [Bacteroidales bacterium]
MKAKVLTLLMSLFLGEMLFAQNYYMQYSHDTLGNRTGRVRGIQARETDVEVSSDTLLAEYYGVDDTVIDSDWQEDGMAWADSDNETEPHGSLIKTRAEKEVYIRQMRESVEKLMPIVGEGDSRDINDYDVGAIPLQYGVSPTGARTYSIPIQTAPDIKYAPSLSLVYNSQGGYGYGGYGWDLAGLSAITLTGKSLYYDGENKGASAFNTDAVFQLDGVRLVQNEDPMTATDYPLVTATGHILVAPHYYPYNYVKYFDVLFPNGVSATYGSDSLSVTSQLLSYPMVESVSPDGDVIKYKYIIDSTDGSCYINRIQYGFDSSGQAGAEIWFQQTGFSTNQYYAGKKLWRKPRILYLSSSRNGQRLFGYDFSYTNYNTDYLLTSLSISESNNHHLPPLEFTYGISTAHVGQDSLFVQDSLELTVYYPNPDTGKNYSRGKFVKGSYNDGLLIYPIGEVFSGSYMTGFSSPYPTNQRFALAPYLSDVSFVSTTIVSGYGFQTIEAVDYDGDGLEELVRVNFDNASSAGTRYSITGYKCDSWGVPVQVFQSYHQVSGYIRTYVDYSPSRRAYRWGDFNGDGKCDLLMQEYSGTGGMIAQQKYTTLIDLSRSEILFETDSLLDVGFSHDRDIIAIDIDNDGVTELCHAQDTCLRSFGFDGESFILKRLDTNLNSSIVSTDRSFFTDINADGYIDLLTAPTTGAQWNLYINTGISFIQSSIVIGEWTPNDKYFFIDINRDGYPDVVKINGTSFGYYLNHDGEAFGSYKVANSTITNANGILPGNVVDYSSMSAFIKVDGEFVKEYAFTSYVPEMRQLIQSKDSYGKILRNSYGYLPQSSLIWTDNPSWISDGYQLRVLPLYVLTGTRGLMSEALGAQTFLLESYSWYDGVLNTHGLGFCGFSKIRKENINGTPVYISVSTFNPQKKGVPVSEASYLQSISNTPYSTASYTFDNHSTTYGKLSPRLSESVTHDNLTGIVTTTGYVYDSFDYPTKITTTRQIGQDTSSAIQEVDTRSYTHSNLPDTYVLGSMYYRNVTVNNRDGQLGNRFATRVRYTYDSNFRPLTEKDYKVWYPYGTGANYEYLLSTTRWTYDSHGNVLTEETAPYNATEYTGNTYTYDSGGRHLATSTDALGHTTTYSNHDRFGNPRTVTDYRGRVTTLSYDSWGRKTKTVYAEGTVDSTALAWGGRGVYTAMQTVTGKPSVEVHYDAMDREVMSAEQRFDGQWQKTRTTYDNKGRVQNKTLPYKGESASYFINYDYDSYNRPTAIRRPGGRKTKWQYSGTSVTETQDSVVITKTTNSMGDLVSVTDAAGTTTYTLRDDGLPSSVTAPGGATTTFTYDDYGRRTSIVDPSAGTRNTSYTVNSDGSTVTTETNALGSIATSVDKYGRVTGVTRTGTGAFNTTYNYDTYGRLSSVVSTNSTSKEYTYDSYDRVSTFKETVPDSKWLKKTYNYGAGSNVASILYRNQSEVITTEVYSYTNGHNTSISLLGGTNVLTILGENDLGQPTTASSGGVRRTYAYTAHGYPTSRELDPMPQLQAKNSNDRQIIIQKLWTTFDPHTGNLTQRVNAMYGPSYEEENFSYDALGRLKSTTFGNITYDIKGNIVINAGVGTMTYPDSNHPYRVERLNASSASVTRPNAQLATYTAYDRPATVSDIPQITSFTYNADYDRVKMQTSVYSTSISKKYYIGGRYEREETTSSTTERLFVGGDAYSAPMVLQKTGSGNWTPYVIGRDYLGSITHVVTTSGTLVAEYSYDPWGRMRDPETLTPYASTSQPSLLLGRGFCGHEHLPNLGLINMNARLYDPVLGRFLSPDPYVQSPDLSQNFNRYAYALNNPLKYTDETGEFALTTMLIAAGVTAAVFGVGNLAAHAIRQDDLGNGNWAKYLFSGALAGFAVGSLGYLGYAGLTTLSGMAGFWGNVGKITLTGAKLVTELTAISSAAGIIGGAINRGWAGVANAGKIMLGNFYLDENKSFFGQVWEGISRHTWEFPQQAAGYFWSGIRNCWADRVDYWGGATFVTYYCGHSRGATMGGYININNGGKPSLMDSYASFDDYMLSNTYVANKYYIHEYGHTIQSKIWGPIYLPVPAILSLWNCRDFWDKNKTPHDDYWTEVWANTYSKQYYKNNFPGYSFPSFLHVKY